MVLFSSDNHGNDAQYAKIVAAALARRVNAVVFGGDLSPKCQYRAERDYYRRMAREQGEWIRGAFADALRPLAAAGIPVFLIVGNGDVSTNYEAHLANEAAGLYTCVDCRRVPLTTVGGVAYELLGFPFVPFGGSSMKDFEMHDSVVTADNKLAPPAAAGLPAGTDRPPWYPAAFAECHFPTLTYYDLGEADWPMHSREQRRAADFRAPDPGRPGWRRVACSPARSTTHALEVALAAPPFTPLSGPLPPPGGSGRTRTLLVAHAPPFGTCADMLHERRRAGGRAECGWCTMFGLPAAAGSHRHAGSAALRAYLERERPWCSMSGHYHETAVLAGRVVDTLPLPPRPGDARDGDGVVHFMTSGNDPLYRVSGVRDVGRHAEVPVGTTAWAVLFDVAHPAAAVALEL